MRYDFDQEIERIGTSCSKWDSKEDYRTGKLIPMWVADMDFPIAEPIRKKIYARMQHPIMGYVYRGTEFSEIASMWMKKRHGWEVNPAWVTFTPGIVPALSAAIQAFTKHGDSVMIQSPVYYPFQSTIQACGRKVVDNPVKHVKDRYRIDFVDMEKKLQDNKVKLLLFCNPHNPVGRVYEKKELETLGNLCVKYHVKIFSDEIHSDLVLNRHRHIPLASLSETLSYITMTGIAPSKTFNLAGLQTAAVICGNQEMRAAFERIITMNGMQFPNVFGLEAFKAAYLEGEEYLVQLLAYLEGNLEYCKHFFGQYLNPLQLTELEGTYLLWIDCKGLKKNSDELEQFMHQKAGLELDSGHWFGETGDGFMRMNIACPRSRLEKALNQLKEALEGEKWKMRTKRN